MLNSKRREQNTFFFILFFFRINISVYGLHHSEKLQQNSYYGTDIEWFVYDVELLAGRYFLSQEFHSDEPVVNIA
jgi:hypothetical protein